MRILAIESSCDETAVAVVENGNKVLSNSIASQILKHVKTGGVVPEVAAREHLKHMMPTVRRALEEAQCTWDEIDAIAVTKEPGLPGALMVGRMTAAALAFALDKPLMEVNHCHGHLFSAWLEAAEEPEFPILALSVSGGHNDLALLKNRNEIQKLGTTLDDAAGEAFDKVARLLGLGYPGGPVIEEWAKKGNPKAFDFPRAKIQGYDFSFSGLKTSVLYLLKKNEKKLKDESFIADVAASFQEAVVDALLKKLQEAIKKFKPKEVHLVGGVSANRYLRGRIEMVLSTFKPSPVFRVPARMAYCTDNAAMIAAVAYYKKTTGSKIDTRKSRPKPKVRLQKSGKTVRPGGRKD